MENKHWEIFFHGIDFPLDEEVSSDIFLGLLQTRFSLFFNRVDGTIIPEQENAADSFLARLMLSAQIVEWIGRRNIEVATAEDGREQRAAVSQQSILIDSTKKGEYDVNVDYYLFEDAQELQTLKVSI